MNISTFNFSFFFYSHFPLSTCCITRFSASAHCLRYTHRLLPAMLKKSKPTPAFPPRRAFLIQQPQPSPSIRRMLNSETTEYACESFGWLCIVFFICCCCCFIVIFVYMCLSVPSTRRPHNPASIHHSPPTSHPSWSHRSVRHPHLRPHSHWQQRYSTSPHISTGPSACHCLFLLPSYFPLFSYHFSLRLLQWHFFFLFLSFQEHEHSMLWQLVRRMKFYSLYLCFHVKEILQMVSILSFF